MKQRTLRDTFEYGSMAECANRLGISEDLLEDHIQTALYSGRIASWKIGTRRSIEWVSLIAFLDAECDGALPGYTKGGSR
jgi:hypothetical protein